MTKQRQRRKRRPIQEVTMKDVANEAGVSLMTVSRVLNGEKYVRSRLQERVRQAAIKLDYRLNSAARTLASGELPEVGFIYSNPSHAYLSELLVGALQESTALGLRLTLGSATSPTERLQQITSLLDSGVNAFFLPPSMCNSTEVLSLLREASALWVAISPASPESHLLNVSADHFDAAHTMTSHLVALGHRHIGFVTGDPASKGGADRYRGHLNAMAEAGLQSGPVEQGYFTFQSGLDATERLLSRSPQCTAIIACNDDMAAAAISVAHRHGLHVPDDLTVVGFDDTPISSIVSPAITTVRQPISQMAQTAIRMLDEAMKAVEQGREILSTQERFHCTLIERQSSAPPRSNRAKRRRPKTRDASPVSDRKATGETRPSEVTRLAPQYAVPANRKDSRSNGA